MADSPDTPIPAGTPWTGPYALAGSAPVPDPTRLTTDAVEKAKDEIEKLYNAKLTAIESRYDVRLEGLQELFDQQFKSAEEQRKEQKADTKTAVDAALQAQKEAVREQTAASDRAITKSEGGMIEQLKQLGQTVDTKVTGLTTAHNDLKTRVERMESEARGQTTQVSENRAATGAQLALAGVILVILNLVIGVVIYIATTPNGTG